MSREAEIAYNKYIAPAIDAIATDCTRRMMDIAVTAPSKEGDIKWMALTLSNLRALQSHMASIMASDAIDEKKRAHDAEIAKMSPERRKILGLL